MNISKNLIICFFIFILIIKSAYPFDKEIHFSIGLDSVSFTENESTLDDSSTFTKKAPPANGTMSQISLNVKYHFFHHEKMSIYGLATLPALNTGSTGYFQSGAGINFYIGSQSGRTQTNYDSVKISTDPIWRYFWGIQTGLGYLIYATNNAEKSDIQFETSIHCGAIYNFNKDFGMTSTINIGRGIGVASTTLVTRALIGVTYFFD